MGLSRFLQLYRDRCASAVLLTSPLIKRCRMPSGVVCPEDGDGAFNYWFPPLLAFQAGHQVPVTSEKAPGQKDPQCLLEGGSPGCQLSWNLRGTISSCGQGDSVRALRVILCSSRCISLYAYIRIYIPISPSLTLSALLGILGDSH